jgi:hypothetical protein
MPKETSIFNDEDFDSDVVDILLAQRESELDDQAEANDTYYAAMLDEMYCDLITDLEGN